MHLPCVLMTRINFPKSVPPSFENFVHSRYLADEKGTTGRYPSRLNPADILTGLRL